MTSVLWFRRDLRLTDHPALQAAGEDGPVVGLFVLDEVLLRPAGNPRLAFLYRTLRALDAALRQQGGALVLRRGNPVRVVTDVAREVGARSVHVSEDFGPYGRRRDYAVEAALVESSFLRSGSPYAVSPGQVLKADGTGYKVFTPFYRAWSSNGWREPSGAVDVTWRADLVSEAVPDDPELPDGLVLPQAGEEAALVAWARYRESCLANYAVTRDRPDLDATSRMSPYLKWGSIHPRTMLADLGSSDLVFVKELAWREFYAHVLHHWPDSARSYFQPSMNAMSWDEPGAQFQAWRAGRTGYPIVDAGMRQLLAEGWMHNRVRMIVASFLVKDLHIDWPHGARYFMSALLDGDLASNQHGWQWTAGTGTDASPYFRVFNPVGQGKKFDPSGDYVRRWIPELRAIDGPKVHEPWLLATAPPGYPAPIVDHAVERAEALARYAAIR